MHISDILFIILMVVIVVLIGLYFFSRRSLKNSVEASNFINQNKQTAQIFVIDKKLEKPSEQNLPKVVYEKLPRTAKMRKMPLVKAKVGPQIVTLTCDKALYQVLAVKKTVKVELAGIYISNIVGMNLEDKKKKTWRDKLTLYVRKHQ